MLTLCGLTLMDAPQNIATLFYGIRIFQGVSISSARCGELLNVEQFAAVFNMPKAFCHRGY